MYGLLTEKVRNPSIARVYGGLKSIIPLVKNYCVMFILQLYCNFIAVILQCVHHNNLTKINVLKIKLFHKLDYFT